MTIVTSSVAPKAGRREWIGLAVLALPTLLVSVDVFVLLLALPHLAEDLGANSNEQLWITDIYGFVLAGFLVTMGSLGDRIGRRRLLLVGAALFGLMSLLSAFSQSPEMLIASRALLGLAGATLTPSTLALISNMFHDPKQRATAISAWGGMWTLGAIVGPIVGGVFLSHFWWGSVFLLGVPVMVLLLVVGPLVLPEHRSPTAGRLDPLSVVLSLGTVLPVVWGIKQLSRDGWAVFPAAMIVLGVLLGFLFLRRQRMLADPLLDLKLFRGRDFSTALGGLMVYSFIGGGTMLFMLMYFQLVDGMSPLRAGFAMVPGMLGGMVAFAITPILAARIRPAYVIAGGLVASTVVLLFMSQVSATSGTMTLIIGFAVFSFFGVPLVALGTGLVVGVAPPEKGGSAGSLTQLSNEFGATLGAAMLGTLGFTVYRHLVADDIPAGVPDQAAAATRDSMAGASASAASLPEQVRDALLTPAREAFASGLQTVILVNAALLLILAVVILVNLRHLPPLGQIKPEQPAEGASDAPARPLDGAVVD